MLQKLFFHQEKGNAGLRVEMRVEMRILLWVEMRVRVAGPSQRRGCVDGRGDICGIPDGTHEI